MNNSKYNLAKSYITDQGLISFLHGNDPGCPTTLLHALEVQNFMFSAAVELGLSLTLFAKSSTFSQEPPMVIGWQAGWVGRFECWTARSFGVQAARMSPKEPRGKREDEQKDLRFQECGC